MGELQSTQMTDDEGPSLEEQHLDTDKRFNRSSFLQCGKTRFFNPQAQMEPGKEIKAPWLEEVAFSFSSGT